MVSLITVTREIGSLGREIAKLIGDTLGMRLVDPARAEPALGTSDLLHHDVQIRQREYQRPNLREDRELIL